MMYYEPLRADLDLGHPPPSNVMSDVRPPTNEKQPHVRLSLASTLVSAVSGWLLLDDDQKLRRGRVSISWLQGGWG